MNNLTKRTVFIFLCLTALACASCATAPVKAQGITLDQAIQEASANIETNLSPGTKAAVLYFTSPSEAFSEYVLEELSTTLVNGRKIMIVDRKNLDAIRAELNFNMSGEVSDESAQEIGRMLGAQSIVFGTLSVMGGVSRFRVKTINTENANIEASSSVNIVNDEQVKILLATSGGAANGNATGPQYGGAAAQGRTVAGGDRQTAQTPAKIPNGTYTFFPRPQATKGGLGVDAYLVKIVVRGNYFIVYMDRVARGMTSNRAMPGYWYLRDNVLLTDMDHPAKTWKPVNHTENNGVDGEALSFENVTGTRFSLECDWYGPNIFEEIILGEPDAQ